MADSILMIHDERMLEHENGPGHPERPDRVRAILRGLEAPGDCVVVTDDREVAANARRLGATTMAVESFMGTLRNGRTATGAEDGLDAKTMLSPAEQKAINAELRQIWGVE